MNRALFSRVYDARLSLLEAGRLYHSRPSHWWTRVPEVDLRLGWYLSTRLYALEEFL